MGAIDERCSSAPDLRGTALDALQEALRCAGPALLDLIVEFSILVPEEWEQAVAHDFKQRDLVYVSLPVGNGYHVITTRMTLQRSFGFAARLKTLSQGTGAHTIRLARETCHQA